MDHLQLQLAAAGLCGRARRCCGQSRGQGRAPIMAAPDMLLASHAGTLSTAVWVKWCGRERRTAAQHSTTPAHVPGTARMMEPVAQ